MCRIIIAGSGTEVGKTIVSAIFVTLMQGDYWKPIQCGTEDDLDTERMRNLIDSSQHHIYPSIYSLKYPLSPHHAARLEGITIDLDSIVPPQTKVPLIIESVGGVFVPLSIQSLSIDLFKKWNSRWIIVSRHYLGSINHTLLTIDALKQRNISIAGLIFNGEPNFDSENAILEISQLPLLGRLLPEAQFNQQIIQKYVKQWQKKILKFLL